MIVGWRWPAEGFYTPHQLHRAVPESVKVPV
jgi:hypothetical protein